MKKEIFLIIVSIIHLKGISLSHPIERITHNINAFLMKNIIQSLSDLVRQDKEERNIKNDICQDHLINEMHCRFYNVEEKRIIVRSLSDLVRQGSKLLWRFGLGEENPHGVQVCLFRDGGYIRSWAFFHIFPFFCYKMLHNQ